MIEKNALKDRIEKELNKNSAIKEVDGNPYLIHLPATDISVGRKVGDKINIKKIRSDIYLIHLPFTDPRNDHFSVLIKKKENDQYILSDGGSMIEEFDLVSLEPSEYEALFKIIENQFGYKLKNGEEWVFVGDLEEVVEALPRFVSTILSLSSLIHSEYLDAFEEMVGG